VPSETTEAVAALRFQYSTLFKSFFWHDAAAVDEEAVPSETTEAVAVLEEAAAAAAALGGATDHGSRGGRGATRAADKAAAEAAELQRQRSRCADETKGGEGVERVLLRKITPSAVQGQSHYLAVPIAGLQGTGTSWQKLLVWQWARRLMRLPSYPVQQRSTYIPPDAGPKPLKHCAESPWDAQV